jgi:hypothetical protein
MGDLRGGRSWPEDLELPPTGCFSSENYVSWASMGLWCYCVVGNRLAPSCHRHSPTLKFTNLPSIDSPTSIHSLARHPQFTKGLTHFLYLFNPTSLAASPSA